MEGSVEMSSDVNNNSEKIHEIANTFHSIGYTHALDTLRDCMFHELNKEREESIRRSFIKDYTEIDINKMFKALDYLNHFMKLWCVDDYNTCCCSGKVIYRCNMCIFSHPRIKGRCFIREFAFDHAGAARYDMSEFGVDPRR